MQAGLIQIVVDYLFDFKVIYKSNDLAERME